MDCLQNEAMINGDFLQKVNKINYKNKPYCSLAALTATNKYTGQSAYGTGTLISPNLILTVAHNFYDSKAQQPYRNPRYILSPHGSAKLTDYKQLAGTRYLKQNSSSTVLQQLEHDFALVRLNEQFSYDQCMELTICCQKCTFKDEKQILQIYGYPCSLFSHERQSFSNYTLNSNSNGEINLDQWGLQKENPVYQIQLQKNMIRYQLTTFPGQSGTAVIYGNKFVGMHKAGSKAQNIGRLITIEMVEKLVDWTKQLKGRAFRINTRSICKCLEERVKKISLQLILINAKPDTTLEKVQREIKNIGLQEYYHLKYLNLQNNKLSSIDLSHNIQLSQLNLACNNLVTLDLSNNTQITQLYLHQNQIASLDISKNVQLTKLYLTDNQLDDLDVSKNILLIELSLSLNKIKTINVFRNTELLNVSLDFNQLNQIDLSLNTKIILLFLNDNKLASIALPNSQNLNQLRLDNNLLKSVDLSRYAKLNVLLLSNNCLSNVVFLFKQSLQWNMLDYFELYDQNSQNCEVTILYKKQDEKESEKFVAEGVKGFEILEYFSIKNWFWKRQPQFKNRYNCNYQFKMITQI